MSQELTWDLRVGEEQIAPAYDQIGAHASAAGEAAAQSLNAAGAAADKLASAQQLVINRWDSATSAANRAASAATLAADAAAKAASGTSGGFAASNAALDAGQRQLTTLTEKMQHVGPAATEAATGTSRFQQALDLLHPASQKTSGLLDKLSGSLGGVFGSLVLYQGLSAITQGVTQLGSALVSTAASAEQNKIAFTTFLGSAATMKTFLADLQQFANVSPFTFTDLQQDAKFLLAMGTAGSQVLPVLKDVSAAVAAAGGGGEALQRVTAAYAKINAEGKTSAIFLNELTRDGVPAWNMLAESMGKSVAQVRDLAAQGAITSAVFDKAFHTYTVEHYGDMLKQQSRTLNGLISTIEDVGGAFARALGGPVIAAIEPELAHLTDELTNPQVATTLAEWGHNLGNAAFAATQLWDRVADGARAAFAVVKPVFDAMGFLLASLPNAPTAPDPVAPKGGMPPILDSGSVDTAKTQVDGLQERMKGLQRAAQDTAAAYDAQLSPLKDQLTMLDRIYAAQNASRQVADLQKKIAIDTALGKDFYSSEGKAARDRLVTEKEQLATQQAGIAHTGQQNSLQDQMAAIEKKKAGAAAENQLAQRKVQDAIDAVRDAATKASAAVVAGIDRQSAAESTYLKSLTQGQLDTLRLADADRIRQGTIGGITGGLDAARVAGENLRKEFDKWGSIDFSHFTDKLGATNTTLNGILLTVERTGMVISDPALFGRMLAGVAEGRPLTAAEKDLQDRWLHAGGETVNGPSGTTLPGVVSGGMGAAQGLGLDANTGAAAGLAFGLMLGQTVPHAPPPSATLTNPDIASGGGFPGSAAQDAFRARIGSGRAGGGPVAAGTVYPVGEHGPEWFAPATNGTIIPNGGGGGTLGTIEVVLRWPDGSATRQWVALNRKELARGMYDYASGAGV